MRNSPDRAPVKKKWAVNKADGPLPLYAELVLKKLLAHKIPCQITWRKEVNAVQFAPARYRPGFGPDFSNFLQIACRTVNADRRVAGGGEDCDIYGFLVRLNGPHHIDKRGNLRIGKGNKHD